jgi:hypothetical protein
MAQYPNLPIAFCLFYTLTFHYQGRWKRGVRRRKSNVKFNNEAEHDLLTEN